MTYKRKTKVIISPDSTFTDSTGLPTMPPDKDIIRKHEYENKNSYEGGATRSKESYAYHLIPVIALKALSDRYFLGAVKHGEGNWKQGEVNFIKQCFNHLINHYRKELDSSYDDSIEQEDSALGNLGAILWAGASLVWFKRYKNELYYKALKELHEGKVENVITSNK